MAETSEALFENALNDAVEEAIAEVDSVEGDEPVEMDAVSDDEPAESEQDVDDTEDIEAEAELENDEDLEDEPAVELAEWNGNPDELPSDIEFDGKKYDLLKTYRAMQSGYDKMRHQHEQREREREALHAKALANLESQQKAQVEAKDVKPKPPTEDMTPDQQNERWSEITRWESRQAFKEMVANGSIPDPARVEKQTAEFEEQNARNIAMAELRAQEGYTDDMWEDMTAFAGSNPFWHNQPFTGPVLSELFRQVKSMKDADSYKKQAAAFENEKVKRTASAAKRATPKPVTQTKSATSAAENFKNMGFEERIDAAIKDGFGL